VLADYQRLLPATSQSNNKMTTSSNKRRKDNDNFAKTNTSTSTQQHSNKDKTGRVRIDLKKRITTGQHSQNDDTQITL
jgi:hypothetical protein